MINSLRKAFWAALFILPFTTVSASGGNGQPGQTASGNPEKASGGTPLNLFWQEVGPNNLGTLGRAIEFDASGNLFAGSLGGGLFKSSDLGLSWARVSGLSDNLAVSSIAIDGNKIFVGTGEKYFYDAPSASAPFWDYQKADTFKMAFHTMFGRPGEGVYVSTDGGSTWSHNNAVWSPGGTPYTGDFSSIQKVAAKNGRVFVASLNGLYWSDDNLVTKTKCTGTPSFTNFPVVDIEFGNNNRVFATNADSVYVSDDGGLTFGPGINALMADRDINYPSIGGQRVAVAVSSANPDYVYVTGAGIIGNCTGVWKSTDNGNTWDMVAPGETAGSVAFAPFKNTGKYNLLLEVSASDPDHYYVGGNRLYVYTDTTGLIQAASTTYIPGFSTNYVPQPQMDLVFNPANTNQFFVVTDKEIMRTDDGGKKYTFKTKGFNAGHSYSIHAAPNYKVLASERTQGVIYKGSADTSQALQQFQPVHTVCGHAAFSMIDFNHAIAQGSDGGLVRSLANADSWEEFYGVPQDSMHPSLGTDSIFVNKADSNSASGNLYDSGGQPFTPWCFDEVFTPSDLLDDSTITTVPGYVFMCSRSFVWLVTNPFGGVDSLPKWTRVSPNLTPNKLSTPREYLTAITVSGDNTHTVYAATNYGRIYRIQNANDPASLDLTTRFAMISDNTLPARWITDLEIDPSNHDNLLVTYGAYDNSGSSRVYMTNNATDTLVTWKSVGDNLPTIPVYSAAFHPDPAVGALLVGTEEGMYSTTDDWNTLSSLNWSLESNGMGIVPVTDIYIRPYFMNVKGVDDYSYAPDHVIFASTLGRGIFKSQNLVSREPDGQQPVSVVDVKLYPNPSAGNAWIEHTLSERSMVTVEVYNYEGRLVKSITNREYNAGTFLLDFSGEELRSGIYFVKSTVKNPKGEFNKTLKAVVVK